MKLDINSSEVYDRINLHKKIPYQNQDRNKNVGGLIKH